MSITIIQKTGDAAKSGTDYDVEMRFKYSDGNFSDWYFLDNRGDDRESRSTDKYYPEVPNPSAVVDCEMRVRHEPAHRNDDVSYDAWYFSWMWIYTPVSKIFYNYDGWVTVPKGDPNWHDVQLIITKHEIT